MSKKHSHYFKDVSGLQLIDVYEVLSLFGVTDHAIGHAIKKLLCAGQRGSKGLLKDYGEAIDSIQRACEMLGGAPGDEPAAMYTLTTEVTSKPGTITAQGAMVSEILSARYPVGVDSNGIVSGILDERDARAEQDADFARLIKQFTVKNEIQEAVITSISARLDNLIASLEGKLVTTKPEKRKKQNPIPVSVEAAYGKRTRAARRPRGV